MASVWSGGLGNRCVCIVCPNWPKGSMYCQKIQLIQWNIYKWGKWNHHTLQIFTVEIEQCEMINLLSWRPSLEEVGLQGIKCIIYGEEGFSAVRDANRWRSLCGSSRRWLTLCKLCWCKDNGKPSAIYLIVLILGMINCGYAEYIYIKKS